MRVERLRPKWSDERLTEIYARPHDHRLYGRGHGERVEKTIEMGTELIMEEIRTKRSFMLSGADLSCGNGEILRRLPLQNRVFGDFAPCDDYEVCGPLEQTLIDLPPQDIYVCSETIEHLDNPDGVLTIIPSRFLLLSTPIEAWGDTNAEHYWAWDREYIEWLLERTGWHPVTFDNVDSREYFEAYNYGIWTAQR